MKNHLAATSARSISAVMMMVLGLGACASPKNEEDAIEQRQSALTYPLPNATGDPQFFGFGYPQLAIMDGTNLQVLASPVRVQDAPWTTRWLSPLAAAPPVIVAGDFWHTGDGKARLLAIKNGAASGFLQTPEERQIVIDPLARHGFSGRPHVDAGVKVARHAFDDDHALL